jgi:hypothetical protein
VIDFARLAPLGFVLEALIAEKHLFAGGEDKFPPALAALQDLVLVFHTLLPYGFAQDSQRHRPGQPSGDSPFNFVASPLLARTCMKHFRDIAD